MSGRQKQVKELIHAAKDQGWDVEVDGSGHFRLTPPGDDQVAISISSTPSDYRTLKNEAAKLKRMGLQLPGQAKQTERLCLASWHSEPDAPIGFCGHCRGTWKVTEDDDIEAFLSEPDKQEFVIPEEWTQPRLSLRDEVSLRDELEADEGEVSVDVDEGSIRSRVLKAMQELHGEFLSTDEVASITDLPKASAGAALRQLYAKGDLTRSKRGRYGIPKPEKQIEPEPEVEVVVDLTPAPTEPEPEITVAQTPAVTLPQEQPAAPDPAPAPSTAVAGGPPDPSKAWRWVPDTGWVEDSARPADVALYEGTGLKDKQQRPIIKDENGDLYVAIPLVMGI